MCGIAGLATCDDPTAFEHALRRMNGAMVHRGPDDSGMYVGSRCGLAMRRLAIVDVPGGHQPISTADGVSIVFNGEIYNFLALREELIGRGYRFKSHSDTEVVLNLYHAEGIEGFKRLHGMFAIAIHDGRSEELILARDQIGIKPLYYLLDADRFLFASEIKAILAALPSKPSVNPQAVWDFLTLRYSPPPQTIWNGIAKLEPGHALLYALKTHTARITCFWRPNLTPAPFEGGRDYAREFEDRFLEAVQSHIVASDVPVGMFLSGGLDSGAICAAAIELGHKNFHTFSIGGSGGGADDELPLAKMVAAKFGTNHHETVMDARTYFDQLPDVARQFDEPYGDETGAALFLLSKEAQRYVKVVMSGEGSDELLLGYARPAALEEISRVRQRYRPWPAGLLRAASHVMEPRRARILRAVAAEGPGAYRKGAAIHIGSTLSHEEKLPLWRRPPLRPTEDLIGGWYTLPPTVHPLAQSQQADFQTWLVEDLLMKADKMAMASSLEVRVPFLHLPLVEWCQRSPMEVRIGGMDASSFQSKAILRQFVSKRLPAEILAAPKRGFPVPTTRWLEGMLRERGSLALSSRAIHDWIRVEALDPFIRSGVAGDRKALAQLWGVVMLDHWFKAYLD